MSRVDRKGLAMVRIIQPGVLDAKEGDVVHDFQFRYGVLKFVQKDSVIVLTTNRFSTCCNIPPI